METVVLDSKNSLEESITAMESLIQQGVDGISIFPISTEQGAQLVKMANEAGIPVTVENFAMDDIEDPGDYIASVSYTHLRAHETGRNLVCRLLLEKKKSYLVCRLLLEKKNI